MLVLHHIASDGWSLAPLGRDLATAYRARCREQAPDLPPLPVQYADFTLWQYDVLGREDDPDSAIARQLAFWTQTLKGLPDQLDLPIDRPRPAVSSHRGDSVAVNIELALHARLLALARENQASLFMVLHAGLAALLTRLGAGTDIPIGSPIAGRADSALDDLVGFFVNTLVLRTDTAGSPSFRDLIRRVRAADLAAYEHQDLPFERLVEVLNPTRSLARHPLFQVMLAFEHNVDVRFDVPDLSATWQPFATDTARFDLAFSLTEQRSPDGGPAGIGGILQYATDLYDRASAESLCHRLICLLEAAVAEPDQAIGKLDILAPAERHRILREWNDTARPIQPATLLEMFAGQVARAPEPPRWCWATKPHLSAAGFASQPARAPSARMSGSERNRCVGLCVQRSFELLIGLLGILKAGGAFLPLDPAYPHERLAFMLQDAEVDALVTHSALIDRLPTQDAPMVQLDADWPPSLGSPGHACKSSGP